MEPVEFRAGTMRAGMGAAPVARPARQEVPPDSRVGWGLHLVAGLVHPDSQVAWGAWAAWAGVEGALQAMA